MGYNIKISGVTVLRAAVARADSKENEKLITLISNKFRAYEKAIARKKSLEFVNVY